MPERMVPELTRAIDELKFRAIKVYPPYTTCEIYKPPWHPIYEFANERKLAILFHSGVEWQNHTRYLAKSAANQLISFIEIDPPSSRRSHITEI